MEISYVMVVVMITQLYTFAKFWIAYFKMVYFIMWNFASVKLIFYNGSRLLFLKELGQSENKRVIGIFFNNKHNNSVEEVNSRIHMNEIWLVIQKNALRNSPKILGKNTKYWDLRREMVGVMEDRAKRANISTKRYPKEKKVVDEREQIMNLFF